MPRTPIDPGEEEIITFDFAPAFSPGVTITGVTQMKASAIANATRDPNPQSRILSAPTLIASPTTGAALQAVKVLFGDAVAGVVYQLACVVTASDSQTLAIRWNLPCSQPPGT